MNASQNVGLFLITLGLVGLVALILYRRDRRAKAPTTAAPDTAPLEAPPVLSESDARLERLLRLLRQLDDNADDRMGSLKVYLFFLPLFWGLTWGLLSALIILSSR